MVGVVIVVVVVVGIVLGRLCVLRLLGTSCKDKDFFGKTKDQSC